MTRWLPIAFVLAMAACPASQTVGPTDVHANGDALDVGSPPSDADADAPDNDVRMADDADTTDDVDFDSPKEVAGDAVTAADSAATPDGWCPLGDGEVPCRCEESAVLWDEIPLPPWEELLEVGPPSTTPTHQVCDTYIKDSFFQQIVGGWWHEDLYVFEDGTVELMSVMYDPETHELWLDHGLPPWRLRSGRAGVAMKFFPEGVGLIRVRPEEIHVVGFDIDSGEQIVDFRMYPCPPCGPPE